LHCGLAGASSKIRAKKKYKFRWSLHFAFSKKCVLTKVVLKIEIAFFEKCDLPKLQMDFEIAFFEKCKCRPKSSVAFFSHFLAFFAFLIYF